MKAANDRAFKEWAVSCEALQTGRQILLVRKGGIREAGGQFTINDPEFFLLPTYEHQKTTLLQPEFLPRLQEIQTTRQDPGTVTLSAYAVVDTILEARDEAQVNTVAHDHIWNAEYVRQRFDFNPYDPLYLVVLRIYRLPAPQTMPMRPAYGGCKSWITLDAPPLHAGRDARPLGCRLRCPTGRSARRHRSYMTYKTYDILIIGGGIVGLATALAVGQRYPRARVLVLEKESVVAAHQTGHNSGVIHSGIYYEPGSLKAMLCREGNRAMIEFCREHGIAHEVCGKLIVAVEPQEVPRLQGLYSRGQANGLDVAMLSAEEAREWEPHVRCLAAIRVPSTGIVDYRQVSRVYAELIRARGGDVKLGTWVERLQSTPEGHVVVTDQGEFCARFVVNCAGLHSDRVARMAGPAPARVIPFRGEYYELKTSRRELVRGLIYPVPNPDFPFLGVHLTRMIDGSVHAGPNAVLSLKREGYHKTDIDLRDLYETLSYPGFWRLAARNAGEGMREVWRSFSKAAFVRSLQRLVPEIGMDDVIPTHAGVRAQAVMPDGRLVYDFLLLPGDRSLHVCNAPSPAATASLAIGTKIAESVNCPL